MSVRLIRVHGRPVWQVRVSLRGWRRSRLALTRSQAREHEAELLQALRREAQQTKNSVERPPTLRMTFAGYEEDLEARGKGSNTIARAVQTARAFEDLMPDSLDRSLADFGDK